MSASLKERLADIRDVRLERALNDLFGQLVVRQITVTQNFGNLIADAQESVDVTVTGAAIGDFAVASLGVDTVDVLVTAAVTAANTVTVTVANATAGAVDLASTDLNVRVFPKNSYISA